MKGASMGARICANYLIKQVEKSQWKSYLSAEFYGKGILNSLDEKLLHFEKSEEVVELLQKRGFSAFVVNAETLKNKQQMTALGRHGMQGAAMPCILQGGRAWFVYKVK